MTEKIVEFLRKKDYKLIRDIGRGGTAVTVLLKDELIDKEYVCKKYFPVKGVNPKDYFNSFLTEIKLLHEISHQNIVRVYNYYLYPERYTGYLLMEHIDGETISKFISKNPEKINSIFEQTINGFRYLEEHNILHRDIRDTNILVTNDGIVKIIDFGFGKKILFPADTDKSISLNWWCDIPDEFFVKKYGKETDVYFVGKLFENLLQQNQIENFLYYSDLQMMIEKNTQNRLGSFIFLENNLSKKSKVLDFFDDQEKETYRYFADSITRIITQIENKSTYNNFENIIQHLEKVYQENMLESDVENPVNLIRVFLNGACYCDKKNTMSVWKLKGFIDLLKTCSKEKLRVITMHIYNRFDSIERYKEYDIPF